MATVAPSTSQLPITGEPRRETPVFLFAYANDRHDDRRFLRNLADERRRIKQALQGASDQGRCRLVECAGATLDEVLDECQRNSRSLAVFHFAGHADSASLLFETADGHAHTVNADSFTEFLGGLKGLHLVFLNGCCTKAQVEALLTRGVRAVVATSVAVLDEVATELAERFYKAVEGGVSIGVAFEQATGAIRAAFGEDAIRRGRPLEGHRAARDIEASVRAPAQFPWELFGEPDALAHRLMAVRPAESTRCVVVITATLEQFDAEVIARVTAELQRAADDLSLRVTKIERGSVRLHITLSEEGARRLIRSWERGELPALGGFDVSALETVAEVESQTAALRALAGAPLESARDVEKGLEGPAKTLVELVSTQSSAPPSKSLNWVGPLTEGDPGQSPGLASGSNADLTASTEPTKGAHVRKKWARAWLMAAMMIASLMSGYFEATYSCASQPPGCIEEVEAKRWEAAYLRCSAEYVRSRDPEIGFYAAKAGYYQGARDAAARIADSLIPGPRAADAEFLLGSSALTLGEFEIAREHLERALSIHVQAGKLHEQALDAFQLVGVWLGLGEYRRALDVMQVLRAAMLSSSDRRTQVYARLGSADIYRAIGDLRRADEEIERAAADAHHPDDQMQVLFRRGVLQLDAGQHARARAIFDRVLEDRGPLSPEYAELVSAAQLNLVRLDHEQGRLEDALRRLKAHRNNRDEVSSRLLHGMILAGLGRLAEAREELRIAEAVGPRGELSWRVPYQAALVETAAGEIAAAIAASERAIAKVTDLAARSGTYGPEVIATHRQPHFHLIGLHAARRDWQKVLGVIAKLDAHALIDSRAPAELAPLPGTPLVLPAPPRAELGDPDRIVEAWRGRLLVIAVPGGDRAWRLVLHDGLLEGRDLGDLGRLEALARQLADDPSHALAGQALGEALLGGLPADRPIDLLVVGPFAGAAVASLQLGDRLAISHLRIARVPGVLPRIERDGEAAEAPAAPHVVVLGDPRADLPASAEEATQLAARFGTRARIRSDATREAFFAARGADLLHVAAHATLEAGGGAAFVLADGPVTALDIGRLVPAPRRVVLASCAGTGGTDDIGNGSLAHAFLDAGAEYVIAAKWVVNDADAARLFAAFYEAGGDRDPVRALAMAQRQLAGTVGIRSWASFEVFAARPAVR